MEDLTFTCPICGEDVPRRAKSCPGCGACEKSGWSENRYLDGVHLPGEDYESGLVPAAARNPTGKQRFWLFVTILILVAMAWLTLRGMW
jgi:hypothetical protein